VGLGEGKKFLVASSEPLEIVFADDDYVRARNFAGEIADSNVGTIYSVLEVRFETLTRPKEEEECSRPSESGSRVRSSSPA
jgi:hypothetical protein